MHLPPAGSHRAALVTGVSRAAALSFMTERVGHQYLRRKAVHLA